MWVNAITTSTLPSLVDASSGILAASYWLLVQLYYRLYTAPIHRKRKLPRVILSGEVLGDRVGRWEYYNKITCGSSLRSAWAIALAFVHDSAIDDARIG